MTRPKVWNAGVADEAWKVIICARDACDTEDLILTLCMILTHAGGDTAKGLRDIRAMSGDDIMDALLAYVQKSHQAVENALAPDVLLAPPLAEAVGRLLDDMGDDGLSVGQAAKDQAIAALAKARGRAPSPDCSKQRKDDVP